MRHYSYCNQGDEDSGGLPSPARITVTPVDFGLSLRIIPQSLKDINPLAYDGDYYGVPSVNLIFFIHFRFT